MKAVTRGGGARLRPPTSNQPKPLVPIANEARTGHTAKFPGNSVAGGDTASKGIE